MRRHWPELVFVAFVVFGFACWFLYNRLKEIEPRSLSLSGPPLQNSQCGQLRSLAVFSRFDPIELAGAIVTTELVGPFCLEEIRVVGSQSLQLSLTYHTAASIKHLQIPVSHVVETKTSLTTHGTVRVVELPDYLRPPVAVSLGLMYATDTANFDSQSATEQIEAFYHPWGLTNWADYYKPLGQGVLPTDGVLEVLLAAGTTALEQVVVQSVDVLHREGQ